MYTSLDFPSIYLEYFQNIDFWSLLYNFSKNSFYFEFLKAKAEEAKFISDGQIYHFQD